MAPSPGTYVLEGVKLSIDLFKEISGDLPPPTSTVVGLVQQIIAIVETIQDNHDQCQVLVDRLLRLIVVVLAALKQQSTGTPSQREIPPDLEWKIGRFKDNLDRILKDITKVQNVINSQRKRDKLRAALLAGSYKADIKKCHDQLDWAIKEFDVDSHLTDAIRLCKVSRHVQKVLTNQYLEKLPVAQYARFDCERPDRPSSCFKGTREAIIKEITDWIADPSPQAERFFWLNGLADIGKTTIARTVAELSRSLGLLGASFFFSRRGEAELRNPALVFPTIAHQLALFDNEFCERITAAIEADAQAPSASLKQQLDHLIIEPLCGLARDRERVIIIVLDAFDECESVGANTILRLFVAAIPSLPFFLKIFVTSRPEPHIRSVLVPSTSKLRITALHDIEASVVKSDILIYLRANILDLAKKKGVELPPNWVTDEEIELLAEAAGKLFIYAATSLRSLEEAFVPRRQLKLLLKLATAARSERDKSNPFVYLDELYTEVLRDPITPANEVQALELLQVVLGSVVLLRNTLPVDALERLTGMESGDTVATLNSLHSVIIPPSPPDHCPRTYHPSFPDYLQDPLRCTDPGLLIETKKHETRMAICCLRLLTDNLHKGMLEKFDRSLPNSEVNDPEKSVNAAIPPELQYACRYWASHLAKAPCPEDENMRLALAVFASRQLLPWLESMSWMGQTREAVACLEAINVWATKSSASSDTASLLNDGYRLLIAHFSTIATSASHIARYVLPFAPRNSRIRAAYADYSEPLIKVVLGEIEWSPCLMTWKTHSESEGVMSVSISPDGTRIASGSSDGKIHIHDASSGALIIALACESNSLCSLAFSPDGRQVVSGSGDHAVQLWDATTGRELLIIEGHTESVFSVAFSPDGSRIASASGDRTIQVQDPVTGDIQMTLVGHSDEVNSIVFFPDGGRLMSRSDDTTVRIWDVASTTCVAVLEGHDNSVYSVAISTEGSRIASGSADRTIRIWDGSNGATLATLQGHRGYIFSLAFTASGSHLVSGSADTSVRVWNATSGQTIATFRGHTASVRSVVVSPDGRRFVSGSSDKTVRIWDASTLTEATSRDNTSHLSRVVSLAFSSDGTRLASLDYSENVQVWDLAQGRSVLSFSAPPSQYPRWSVHFSQDDTQIVVAHAEHPSTLFEASSGDQIEDEEIPVLDVRDPSPTSFKVDDGHLLHDNISSSDVVCILPPSLQNQVTAITSFKLDGAGEDRVAIGFDDGQVLVLDVTARIH